MEKFRVSIWKKALFRIRRREDWRGRGGLFAALLAAVMLLLGSVQAQETQVLETQAPEKGYVTDRVKITCRTGPGAQYRILTFLNSGDRVEILTREDGWAYVRTPDGLEGWVLSHWLVPDEPMTIRAERVAAENRRLKTAGARKTEELKKLRQRNAHLERELKRASADKARCESSLHALEKGCRDFLLLKSEHERLQGQYRKLEAQLKKWERRRKAWSERYRWMLYGGAIFFAGILAGSASRKMRFSRRRSYL